jgi:tRNA uridine 5-carboxymethylaminomethyl modification enzyme
MLLKLKSSQIKQKVKLKDILLRPEVSIHDLSELYKENRLFNMEEFYKKEVLESVEIDIKYKGYIERERILAEKLMRLDTLKLDKGIDYNLLKSISTEGRQKLSKVKPDTVGQAMRIPGVSPSDINVLLLYMGR